MGFILSTLPYTYGQCPLDRSQGQGSFPFSFFFIIFLPGRWRGSTTWEREKRRKWRHSSLPPPAGCFYSCTGCWRVLFAECLFISFILLVSYFLFLGFWVMEHCFLASGHGVAGTRPAITWDRFLLNLWTRWWMVDSPGIRAKSSHNKISVRVYQWESSSK